MKTLVIVRHAKSSWDQDVIDFERPLKKRGINDAALVANEFKKMNVKIDKVLSSSANRAATTCDIFCGILNIDQEIIEYNKLLYDFSGSLVMAEIKNLDKSKDIVMVFGHNYALTSIVNELGDTYIENLPTSGLAIIQFDVDNWSDINKGKTMLTLFPKELR